MKKRLAAMLAVMVSLTALQAAKAQDDPLVQLLQYEFSDGTVLRYPATYQLALPEGDDDTPDAVELRANRADIFVTLFSAEQRVEHGLISPLDAMQHYAESVDGLDVDFAPTLEIISNEHTVTWVRYDDEGVVGTLQAADVPSGAVVVVDGYGAFHGSDFEAVALAIVADMASANAAFVLDTTAVPMMPFLPQPVAPADNFDTHIFSDERELRFDDDFEMHESDLRRDLIAILVEDASYYADYYLVADRADLNLATIVEVMAFSYVPFEETSQPLQVDAVRMVILAEREIYYWRYDDQGHAGTVVAVETDRGDVLVIDAFGVYPGSVGEDYAVALLLDFVGVPDLLEGEPLDIGGFGDLPTREEATAVPEDE